MFGQSEKQFKTIPFKLMLRIGHRFELSQQATCVPIVQRWTGNRWPAIDWGVQYMDGMFVSVNIDRCHGLSLPMNRGCTGQSSATERAGAEWKSAAVPPQFNVSFSLVSRVSKHLIEFIAIES